MMSKTRASVALIFGGRGYEREVSVRGAENLYRLIPNEKYDITPVFIDRRGRFFMPIESALPSHIARGEVAVREVFPMQQNGRGGFGFLGGFLPIAAAWPLLHGNFGEDGVVQGALECANIRYVGCDTVASATARDKMTVKAIASSLEIPVAPGVLCQRGETESAAEQAEELLGYPMFVKPCRLGSSIGAGVARDRRELYSTLEHALSLDGRAVIEKKINIKKELECAYFAAGGKELVTPPGEILAHGFYDYDKKYKSAGATVSECAAVSESDKEKVRGYAAQLVCAVGLRDLSRLDFFLSDAGEIYFNEINTMPGFTETSLYLRLLSHSGISQAEAASALIDGAMARG